MISEHLSVHIGVNVDHVLWVVKNILYVFHGRCTDSAKLSDDRIEQTKNKANLFLV